MANSFTAQIKIFPYTFAPRNWTWCNGQLLAINQFTAFYSLVGTIYGGDGRTSFGIPQFQGRTPLHAGTAPGLTPRVIGQWGGSENSQVSPAYLPTHSHQIKAVQAQVADTTETATNISYLSASRPGGTIASNKSYCSTPPGTGQMQMAEAAIGVTGEGDGVPLRQPYTALHFCICLEGIYPTRS
ncbi:tail fiber protein [Shewanella cyperi]|nr:tail fiber protein [Shewanella cyperi]